MNPITPKSFDRLLQRSAKPKREPRIIWGLKAIGAFVGRGRDFGEALTMMPDTPVRKQLGRYYAFEADLIAYMKKAGLQRERRG